MKVIIGLGNPGSKYLNTRHNAGFMFVGNFRKFLGWDQYWDVGDWQVNEDVKSKICLLKGRGSKKMLLVKPVTFMNQSGLAVNRIISRFDVDVEKELVVVHDDLDIELGRHKIQKGISPKDHKGIKSVEAILERKNFLRVRIGVDSRVGDRSIPGDEYVLKKMNADEMLILNESIAAAVKALRTQIEV